MGRPVAGRPVAGRAGDASDNHSIVDDQEDDEENAHQSAGFVPIDSRAVFTAVTPVPRCSHGKVQRHETANKSAAQNVEDWPDLVFRVCIKPEKI